CIASTYISADVVIPTVLLNNGQKIPILGFGTSFVTEQAIRDALADGYRHFDTSLIYLDADKKVAMEKIIGKVLKEVLKEGKIKREDLFIVSKLESWDHERTKVPVGIKESLTNLGIDYLDMYLIHSPYSEKPANVSVVDTWLGMNDVLEAKLTKSIGVSNFDEKLLDQLIGKGVVPVTNQCISNPYRTQTKLLSYLTKHNITLTAYSPLGGITDPDLLKEPKLIEIAKSHNVSAAQVALRYQVQRGVITIPSAITPKYIKENLDLFSWKLTDQEFKDAVRDALDDGYRHIDTSLNYKDDTTKELSEIVIGRVLKDVFKAGKIKREDLFIVSKLETDYHARKRVSEGIKTSLANLGLDYLDLYLIHSPSSGKEPIDIVETWLGMSDVVNANLSRSIGVSNFDEAQVGRLLTEGGPIKPVTNQCISNPYRTQKKLVDYLSAHNITLTAYSPIGGRHDPNLLKDPKLIAIGQKHNVSAAQIALRYQVQRNVIVIPKANTPKYLKENVDLFSFQLTEQEVKDVESLNQH
ncbi:unnamed protein product, partial [Oppiella nova]